MQMTSTLPQLLHGFFQDWLIQQRGTSSHTVVSYRDTWRLFLRFVAEQRQRTVAKLTIEQITAKEVLAFLDHCEKGRKVSIGTRNCRLAALRSFFSFVASREPLLAAQCAEVLGVPTKRAPVRSIRSMEVEEIEAILAQPNRKTPEGQRDHALLALLYNTGARIQEVLNLCLQEIRFEPPACVRIIGKGQKERYCPLWPETVALMKALLIRQPRGKQERIFVNRYGDPLGASGVRYKLRNYVIAAAKQTPSLSFKRVSPHLFRHSTACHLLASGVDITVVRDVLGHAHLDTTSHYAQSNLETKRKALEKVTARPDKPPRWKRDQDLLAWLDSLST
jgi:site-specific recombinase XerD